MSNKLQLQKNSKKLLIISGLFTFSMALSNTFVNIFIWRIKQDLVSIGTFNLFTFLLLPLAFTLSCHIIKITDGTRSLRTGIIFHTLFFLLILLNQEDSVKYLIPLGSFLGIAGGFYWSGFHVLSFDYTNEMNRDTFNAYNGVIVSIAGMFAPYIAGLIITGLKGLKGYFIIFGASFIVFLICIIISLPLHSRKAKGELKLLSAFRQSGKGWTYLMIATFFFGIRSGIIMFIINLITYIVTTNELIIGRIALIGALISTGSYELTEKIMKPPRRKLFITLGAIMMALSISILLINLSYRAIIFFTIINSFFAPFFLVPFNSATYNIIDKTHHQQERIEFLNMKEIVINLGRITGLVIYIILVSRDLNTNNLKLVLSSVAFVQLITPFLIKKINTEADII